MDVSEVRRVIEANVRGFAVESIAFEGEGDFCRAYTVNGDWIFRFAHNVEGSRSLEVERALLPSLSGKVSLPVPNPLYFGRQGPSEFCFVGYRKIGGVELSPSMLMGLGPEQQSRCAHDIALFLRELHSYSKERAESAGVSSCDYPFCRTEAGIMEGPAEEIYPRELARLISYSEVDGELARQCQSVVAELLRGDPAGDLAPTLVHGDLSQDHILFDSAAGRISGVIDFTDVVITTPLLDLTYIRYNYGEDFAAQVVAYYSQGDAAAVTRRIALLLKWYLAIRLLWALDNSYAPGIERGLRALNQLMGPPSA